jgi:hypothetical protein
LDCSPVKGEAMMTFNYDDLTDVMFITFVDRVTGPCINIETSPSTVLRVEKNTNNIVGVTILYFLAQVKEGSLDLPEVVASSLPNGFLQSFHSRAL